MVSSNSETNDNSEPLGRGKTNGSAPKLRPAPSEASVRNYLDRAREVCRETFGFERFREGQSDAVRALAENRDVLVIMPTGSGKSLCFQVPALCSPGVTLVVSPLIALMKDQVDSLVARSIPATFINSSLSIEEQWTRLEGLRSNAFRLVYVAPERFRSRAFRRALTQVDVALLAVDESHCISQWGHDFRPDYRRLRQVRELLGGVPCIALTATATPEVQDDIARELDMVEPLRVVVGFDRPNLQYRVQRVRGNEAKQEALTRFVARILATHGERGPQPASGIVYASTRKHAEEVAELLNETEWALPEDAPDPLCRVYHAGLDDGIRRRTQEAFMEGHLPWVAATNAFGMGVDKSDIRFVAHYDLPGSLEAYYQEVGRAGRDGNSAECALLFSEGDRRLQDFFIDGNNPSRTTIEAVHDFLWSLGENPVRKPLVDLETAFNRAGLLPEKINPMAFRSSLILLERAGGVERLDRRDNLAEVRFDPEREWKENPFPESARIKRSLWEALERILLQNDGEPASLRLEHWSSELEIAIPGLRRGFAQLQEEGWIQYTPPFRGRAIRLPLRRQTLDQLQVDFQALRAKRMREEDRLQQMLSFARSLRCRRNEILEHFGEKVPGPSCGSCDTCLQDGSGGVRGEARPLDEAEVLIVRKILSGVGRAKGRCGRQRVVQMLVGSKAEGVLKLGLDRLSTFGILTDLRQTTIRSILDQLEMAGCIRQEGERYPTLVLTEKGWRVIMEEETLSMAIPPFAPGRKPCREPLVSRGGVEDAQRLSSNSISAGDSQEAPYDKDVFERLRQIRYDLSTKLGIPAYQVFGNRTLRAMAREKPRTEEELLALPGVGPITYQKFGTIFLSELRGDRTGATEGASSGEGVPQRPPPPEPR